MMFSCLSLFLVTHIVHIIAERMLYMGGSGGLSKWCSDHGRMPLGVLIFSESTRVGILGHEKKMCSWVSTPEQKAHCCELLIGRDLLTYFHVSPLSLGEASLSILSHSLFHLMLYFDSHSFCPLVSGGLGSLGMKSLSLRSVFSVRGCSSL